MKYSLREKLESIINNESFSDSEITLRLINLINQLDLHEPIKKEGKSISDLYDDTLSKVNGNGLNHDFIKTGFADFDRTIRGFLPGEFVVIGARPGMGKTQFAINLAINIAKTQNTQFYTYDDSEETITLRILSNLCQIPTYKFDYNELTDLNKEMINKVGEIIKGLKLHVSGCNYLNFLDFKADLIRDIKAKKLRVIIVDFLQAIIPSKARNNREFEVGYVCRELKKLAQEFNVCIITTCQLSRAVESRGSSKRPLLSDLRDSGSIEQEADKVLMLYRPEYYQLEMLEDGTATHGLMEVMVVKNRLGRLEHFRLHCMMAICLIKDYDNFEDNFEFANDRLIDLPDF
ncbi:MAG: DnaB-like helicase C-terminal domain-containing protein [Bacteroidota bacterium]